MSRPRISETALDDVATRKMGELHDAIVRDCRGFTLPGDNGCVPSATRLERDWMAQWRRAADALAQVRADELSHLPEADALAASQTLLTIGANLPLSAERITWSGLIEFQRILHGRR